jgi:hypothetical protein
VPPVHIIKLTETETCEIMTFRDSEKVRLLPIMKAAGIKPE